MQRQGRVEKTFVVLSMGQLSHPTFRAEWAHLLVDMEDAGIDPLSDTTLFRRYLPDPSPGSKLAFCRMWTLDPSGPLWKPRTWEEVAQCIGVEFDTRIVVPVLSAWRALHGALPEEGGRQSRRKHECSGRTSPLSHQGDRNAQHHSSVAMGWAVHSGLPQPGRDGGSPGGGAASSVSPRGSMKSVPCMFGATCGQLIQRGASACDFSHAETPASPQAAGAKGLRRRERRLPAEGYRPSAPIKQWPFRQYQGPSEIKFP